MKIVIKWIIFSLPYLILSLVTLSTSLSAKQSRRWLPTDSINIRYFAPPSAPERLQDGTFQEDLIVPSPDGKYFFFVTRQGILKRDSNLYTLWVFSTEDVQSSFRHSSSAAINPILKTSFESTSSSQAALSNVAWHDERSLLFLAMGRNGKFQVHRADVASGDVQQLTQATEEIEKFDYENGSLLYLTRASLTQQTNAYPMQAVPVDANGKWLFGGESNVVERVLHGSYQGADASLFPGNYALWSIGPSGRYAVAVRTGSSFTPAEYVLLDLKTGGISTIAALSGSGWPAYLRLIRSSIQWLSGGSAVVLPNVAVSGASHGTAVVEYDIATKRQTPVMELPHAGPASKGATYIEAIRRDKDGELEVYPSAQKWFNAPLTGDRYKMVGEDWVKVGSSTLSRDSSRDIARFPNGLSIFVRQAANDAPEVIATWKDKDRTVLGADPALNGIYWSKVQSISWGPGKENTGGLIIPRNHKGPFPLVIQAYYYSPEYFLPDGVHSTGDSAQSLAARGIAVLMMEIPMSFREHNQANEGPAFVARVDQAVQSLSRQGLVDPTRVGLTGFSRGGYMTLYAITHPGKTSIAAAISMDSFTGTYASYLRDAAYLSLDGVFAGHEGMAGGRFWKRRSEWLKHETTFNVDKVASPLLFLAHGTDFKKDKFDFSQAVRATSQLDLLGAFRLNERPIDYFYLPDASHALLRPKERLAAMEVSLDWMDFWLNGKEPGNERWASRWKRLREQRDAVLRADKTVQEQK